MMSYKIKYHRLIKFAKFKKFTKVGVPFYIKQNLHYHHIIPKSIDSNSSTCVCLTIPMHVACHYYLWHMYEDDLQFQYAEKMHYAYKNMLNNYYNGNEYEFRRQLSSIEYDINQYYKKENKVYNKSKYSKKIKYKKKNKIKNQNYQITAKEWLRLDGFNKSISIKLKKRLPKDWNISLEDIQSEVNDTFIKLIKLYVPMINGWSLTTYCYQFAEKITYKKLMAEYSRLKKQVSIDEAFIKKYDRCEDKSLDFYERYFRHQYGFYDIEPFTTIEKKIEIKDLIDNLLEIASEEDKLIIQYYIMFDMTQKQIASKLKLSQSTISKRLRKYAQVLSC